MTERPPYGFDCLTCPLRTPIANNLAQGVCHGAPPSDNIVGADQRGNPLRIASQPVTGKGDWCVQHPEIYLRWQGELSRRALAKAQEIMTSAMDKPEGSA